MVKGLATMGTGNVPAVLKDITGIGLATVWTGSRVWAAALSISKEAGLVAARSGNSLAAAVLSGSTGIGLATAWNSNREATSDQAAVGWMGITGVHQKMEKSHRRNTNTR